MATRSMSCGSTSNVLFMRAEKGFVVMSESSEYYVYVYIDPRNFEEFYYGKGIGGRRDSHLRDDSDSEKAIRIKEIHAVGQKPIIKVIKIGRAHV